MVVQTMQEASLFVSKWLGQALQEVCVVSPQVKIVQSRKVIGGIEGKWCSLQSRGELAISSKRG